MTISELHPGTCWALEVIEAVAEADHGEPAFVDVAGGGRLRRHQTADTDSEETCRVDSRTEGNR